LSFTLAVVLTGCTTIDAGAALPLNPKAAFAPIPFSSETDRAFPGVEGTEAPKDSLTLAEALYSINYSRSQCPAHLDDSVIAACDTFVKASAVTTTASGNGEPTAEWIHDRAHTPFAQGAPRPAWDVVVVDRDHEAQVSHHILVDAQTGDLYVDTNKGGYYPSPYLSLSEYGQMAATPLTAGGLAEGVAVDMLTKLNYDL